ncbi:MAG: hypothetical protein AAF430_02155 [Myxococcota bacterium]
MKRLAWGCLLSTLACASPPDIGERMVREGDLAGALDHWRTTDPVAFADRIAAVEAERTELTDGYLERARTLEAEGRLAEALLDYRLALALRPDDTATLAHVQGLAREVERQRTALLETFRQVRGRGDLGNARATLERLRKLDPFETSYLSEQRQLRADIAEDRRRRRERIGDTQAAQVESLVEAGRLAFRDEELETALDLWRRALVMDPRNERIQAYIARAEDQLANLERIRAQPEAGS